MKVSIKNYGIEIYSRVAVLEQRSEQELKAFPPHAAECAESRQAAPSVKVARAVARTLAEIYEAMRL